MVTHGYHAITMFTACLALSWLHMVTILSPWLPLVSHYHGYTWLSFYHHGYCLFSIVMVTHRYYGLLHETDLKLLQFFEGGGGGRNWARREFVKATSFQRSFFSFFLKKALLSFCTSTEAIGKTDFNMMEIESCKTNPN